jgi:hypothetical protein
MSPSALNIECEINTDDLIAWNYYYIQNSSQWKRNIKILRFVLMPVMALCFIAGVIFFVKSISGGLLELGGLGGGLIFLGAFGFIYYLFYPRILRRGIRKNVNKMYVQGKSADIGTHKYSISPEGVHATSRFADSTVKWDAIEDVVQTDKHLFILIHPNKAGIIPKRAFPNDSTFNQFVQD